MQHLRFPASAWLMSISFIAGAAAQTPGAAPPSPGDRLRQQTPAPQAPPVITPPTVDQKMTIQPPPNSTGSMPVITPPGVANPSAVQPK